MNYSHITLDETKKIDYNISASATILLGCSVGLFCPSVLCRLITQKLKSAKKSKICVNGQG